MEPKQPHAADAPWDSDTRNQSLAALAHELRTPLSAIVSLAEIMRDERLGPLNNARYKTYAGDIHDCARHTLDLIAAMLAEVRSGDRSTLPALDFATIDINEIVRGCASAMEPIAARGRATLAAQAAHDPLHVIADRRALRQIVLNLVSNALRFTPEAGTVTLATTACADGRVRLEVSDTGSGMLQKDVAAVLLGPQTASTAPALTETHAAAKTGSGFGLPLVRRLVALHGAEFGIDSSPERGTCVSVTFPKLPVVSA